MNNKDLWNNTITVLFREPNGELIKNKCYTKTFRRFAFDNLLGAAVGVLIGELAYDLIQYI